MAEQFDEELFLGYIEGDLTPEQTQEFEKILVQDARLRNLVAQLVIDRSRLRRMPRELAPPQIMEGVHQHLERHMLLGNPSDETDFTAPARRYRFNRYLAYAGLAAMVLVGAGIVMHTLFNPDVLNLASANKPEKARTTVAQKSPANESIGQVADASGRRDETEKALSNSGERVPLDMKRSESDLHPHAAPQSPAGPAELGSSKQVELTLDKEKVALPREVTPALEDKTAFDSAAKPQPPSASAAGDPAAPSPRSAFADKDVPVPAERSARPSFASDGYRIEAAYGSPADGEKEVLAWAYRHNAQVIPVETEMIGGHANTGDVAVDNKEKSAGEASRPRRVVLALTTHQVPDLLAFINAQRGQSAVLTRTISTSSMAKVDHVTQEKVEARAAGDEATTQPAAAGTTRSGRIRDSADAPVQPSRVKVPAEILSGPGVPDALMRLEIVIEERGPDR